MYKYWVQITVTTLVELRLNTVNNFKMGYVSVIMLSGYLLVLLIKYNNINTVEIYLCLLRVLHWDILMRYHSQK